LTASAAVDSIIRQLAMYASARSNHTCPSKFSIFICLKDLMATITGIDPGPQVPLNEFRYHQAIVFRIVGDRTGKTFQWACPALKPTLDSVKGLGLGEHFWQTAGDVLHDAVNTFGLMLEALLVKMPILHRDARSLH